MEHNDLGQPVGFPMPDWTPRPVPERDVLPGRWCRLERLDPDRHTEDLFRADAADTTGASWTYLRYGPFDDVATYREWVVDAAASTDPRFHAVVDTDPASPTAGSAVGVLSLLRIDPEKGSMEVGHIHYSPALTRTRAATEAQYLLMRQAFDELGYRRYEWKCHALNAASRAAAERLGFTYEGTFRRMQVDRGRNRDTAWFSMIDEEWPTRRAGLEAWLAPENFDGDGRQRTPLRVR